MYSSGIIPSSLVLVLFLHVPAGVLPKSFSLIRLLSRSNRSGFIVYLIPSTFDSRHSHCSSLILECSRSFASSLEFLFHLIFSLLSRS